MANQNSKIDENHRHTLLGVTDDALAELRNLLVNPTTGALKCSWTGTVTDFSIGGILKLSDGIITAPSLTWTTDLTTGFYHTGSGATGQMRVDVNGVKTFQFDLAGVKNQDGTEAAPSYAFFDTGAGFYHSGSGATGVIGTSINGVKVLSESADGLALNAGLNLKTTDLNAAGPYQILATDTVLQVRWTTSGAITINLPTIATVGTGKVYIIVDSGYNANGHNITVGKQAVDTLNNVAGNYVMNVNGQVLRVVSNAITSNWEII
jgi:hypothetical protein